MLRSLLLGGFSSSSAHPCGRWIALVLLVFIANPRAYSAEDIEQGNILIVLVDDVGVDMMSAYGINRDAPDTPNLDLLARFGVVFRNAWSNALCSPSRASIQNGRYGFRSGIGELVGASNYALQLDEITIPEMLDLGTGGAYRHAAIGKWHLGNASVGGDWAPNFAGYDHFAGTMGNLEPEDYTNWTQIKNGVQIAETTYATTKHVDEAIDFIEHAPEPWFCFLSFNAPHYPWAAPPSHLIHSDLSNAGPPETDPQPYYKAMIEAIDTELGRLINEIPPKLKNTTIFFTADNGTPGKVIEDGYDPSKAKSSLFQGGLHIPLIVSGCAVEQFGVSHALVNLTDLYATVADIAGVDLANTLPPNYELDSISLLPYLQDPDTPSLRKANYAEKFVPNGPNLGVVKQFQPDCVCQPNIGYDLPGAPQLSLCGDPLAISGESVLELTGAPANAPMFLFWSQNFNPTDLMGVTITPVPLPFTLPLYADGAGSWRYPSVTGILELSASSTYLQMLVLDASAPFGVTASNTIRANYPPLNVKAIRNERYKLISRPDGVLDDLFFDLAADPLETTDLLTARPMSASEWSEYYYLQNALLDLMRGTSSGTQEPGAEASDC